MFVFQSHLLLLLLCVVRSAAGAGEQCFGGGGGEELSEEAFLEAGTRFAVRLLHALDTSRGDAFFSPFSVWAQLLLLYLGARGATERQLEAVLGLGGADKAAVAHRYRNIKSGFSHKLTSVTMATTLFFQEGLRMHGCLAPFVQGDLAYVDFRRDPELARTAINLLVHLRTGIREVLPPDGVTPATEWVAASTMHFKGAWLQPFRPQATRAGLFFDGASAAPWEVDMMATRDVFPYAESDALQCAALELPYAGGLSMLLLLPRNRAHGVQILARSLTPARLRNLTEELFPRHTLLALPRFRAEHSLRLRPALRRMGLRGALDLRGFGAAGGGGDVLFHKARVAVDERGTEAAAATVSAAARRAPPARTVDFVVDRPFVFFIRESRSNSIFFVGIVRHPKYTPFVT